MGRRTPKKAKIRKNAFGVYERSFSIMKGQPPKDKAAAFCSCNAHKGWLSVRMIREHGCLGKQCPFLNIRHSHPYWEERAVLKERKKARKSG